MSDKVKERLMLMRVLRQTTHDDRMELDRLIEEKTDKYCDEGVSELTDEEIMELLRQVWKRKEKKKPWEKKKEPIPAVV